MEVENPRNLTSSTPISSPILRSSHSGHTSNQSFSSSSLDTASASAHLERYDLPWSLFEIGVFRRGTRERMRSYSAVFDCNVNTPRQQRHVRPLAGMSRKRLLKQIQQLTKDKLELEAQLAAFAIGGSASATSSGVIDASLKGKKRWSPDPAINETSQTGSSSTPADVGPIKSFPFMDGLVGFPSTMAGSNQSLEAISPASLEHLSALASRLRNAVATSMTHLLSEEEYNLLDRPGMRTLLLKEPPQPERAQLYARLYVQRFIEIQKKPQDRSPALQPGPLQQSVKHPDYINILMKELREPIIAHLGAFDQTEFGLWILYGIELHSEGLKITDAENREFYEDDECYEFSDAFFQRFPFIGTKANIDNSNRWRIQRGVLPLTQTSEMAAAEEYTRARQRSVL